MNRLRAILVFFKDLIDVMGQKQTNFHQAQDVISYPI